MDDSNADQRVNDALSDVKQNCVENTNSLPPSSDNSVAKKTSFEITSITEPNNDDNDEDSPDTDSHVHEHRTDNRHDVDLQNYADNMVVYNTSNDLGSSAPVIPTSSQYGLAIVDNSDSGHSLGSIKSEDMHGVDANSQKNECDLNGLQNKNRNERFKVVKIESTEPFKRGRWVCMDFLDHSMNQQQPGNNKIMMVNGDNKAYSQANDLDTAEPLDNGHHECPEFRVCTNNVSTYTSNCNTSDNYKNQTSTYNIVSSGVTTPIHSACVSPGQSLQTNMQVPLVTTQPVAASVQAPQPQSLTQVQLSAQHNINQSGIPHSSLQSHQIQQVIANAGVMQPQLQQTQPVINVMQNQNSPIQPQSIQHLNSVDQHVTQAMPQQYQQPMSQANLQQQQIMQHNIPTQFQKSFVSQNQAVLPNCAPLQQSVNQMINQQVPQYYNSPPVQSQNVTSESSTTVPISNQHISQQQYQSIPIQNQSLQNHVQLQQNQQQLPLPVQQMQQQPNPQQTMVQQNQMQSQMVQQNQQLSHQPSISQPSQPQQTQPVPQQTQQMPQQHIQQPQPTPQPQQTHVQQVPSSQQQQQQQQQGSQQMQQVGQQIQGPQGSQIQQQLPQQTHHITQLTQMTNQSQQMPQSNQMQQIAQQSQQISQQPQQINLQPQQISQQTQLQHPKQMQTTQIQSQPQQISQQQIPQQQQIGQITSQNQMIHQNNQQITHTGQIISQQTLSQAQQLNQNQQVQQQQQQQQQPQQQIQQQLAQTSQSGQSMTQQILQPNQSMPPQNQVLTQQLGINQPNSQMSVPQSQNQQVIQSQQSQHMQQPGQQYQQPQQMMQSQPQQLPMQTNQPLMHQPTYSQAQSLNAMQLQQAVMQQIPTNTVTSTQMHIQQQQPVVPSNMMQQPQISVMSQNNIQPTMPMSQQQMTYSLQQHVPINPNYVNSMQNCYFPSQQQMTYKPSIKTVEAVNKKKEDSNSEDVDNGSTNNATTTVAIDNKIEQAMDLVKSHLMYAVREEVEVLKEKIAELMDKVGLLETENSNLRMLVPPDILEQYNREKQKPTNSQSTHNQ